MIIDKKMVILKKKLRRLFIDLKIPTEKRGNAIIIRTDSDKFVQFLGIGLSDLV